MQASLLKADLPARGGRFPQSYANFTVPNFSFYNDEPMGIKELQEAIRLNNIDMVIQLASQFDKEEIKQVLPEYQKYYRHELTIARDIQDILARTRICRSKKKIPDTGNYTYELE